MLAMNRKIDTVYFVGAFHDYGRDVTRGLTGRICAFDPQAGSGMFGKADPYCKVVIGTQEFSTRPHKVGQVQILHAGPVYTTKWCNSLGRCIRAVSYQPKVLNRAKTRVQNRVRRCHVTGGQRAHHVCYCSGSSFTCVQF